MEEHNLSLYVEPGYLLGLALKWVESLSSGSESSIHPSSLSLELSHWDYSRKVYSLRSWNSEQKKSQQSFKVQVQYFSHGQKRTSFRVILENVKANGSFAIYWDRQCMLLHRSKLHYTVIPLQNFKFIAFKWGNFFTCRKLLIIFRWRKAWELE